MPTVDEHLHRREVEELTELLRNGPGFEDLRQLLAGKGLAASEVFLAGFMENENWVEYGAIVTPGGEVYSYERNTRRDAPAEFKDYRGVRDVNKLAREMFPAVEVALRMVKENQGGAEQQEPPNKALQPTATRQAR